MSTYAPTVEQAARVGTLLARLDDPRELARIAGIGAKEGGLNRADLPSREYIKSRCISIAPTIRNVHTWQKGETQRTMRERGVWMDQPMIDRIAAMAASGMYAQDIAREVGVTRPAITSLMKRRGIEYKRMDSAEISRRGVEASRQTIKVRLTDEQTAEIRRLAALGWLTQPIADAVGAKRGVVEYYAEVNGIAIRKLTRQEIGKVGSEAARKLRQKQAA